MAGCRGLTNKGKPCGFRVKWGVDLCINHDPTLDTRASSRRASDASREARRRKLPNSALLDWAFSLTDRASIQAVLDNVIRLLAAGRIDPRVAGGILRACEIAVRNFDNLGDTIAGPKPHRHDWDTYFESVRAGLDTSDFLLDTADSSEDESGAELAL